MNYDLKNEERLKFLSFLFSERRLATSFVLKIIEKYKKIEKDNFFKDISEFEIYLSDEDVQDILSLAQVIEMTKQNANFSTEKEKQSPKHLLEMTTYFFNEDGSLKITLFKSILRETFNGLSLDDPATLAENIKINMQNIMDRDIQKGNGVASEVNVLKSLSENYFKLSDLTSKKVKESLDEKYIDSELMNNFSLNIIENIRREVSQIGDVNVALSLKTKDVLESIKESSVSEQLKYINLYLERTKRALVQFFNKKSKSSMNTYISKLGLYFRLANKYSDKYQEDWYYIRKEFEQEKGELVNTIHLVIENLEGKQKELLIKSNIEEFMAQFMINDEYDSDKRKKEKRDSLYSTFGSYTNRAFRRMEIREGKELDMNVLKNMWEEEHAVRVELSEEEIEEFKLQEEETKRLELEKIKQDDIINKQKTEVFKKIYKILSRRKNDISVDEFRLDSSKLFNELYIEHDFINMFEGIYTTEQLTDKRVLYRIIEELFEKEFNKERSVA